MYVVIRIEPKFTDQEQEEIKAYKDNGLFDFEEVRTKSGLENVKFNDKQIFELYEVACKKTEGAEICPLEYIRLNYLEMIRVGTTRNKYAYLKKSLEDDYTKAVGQINLNSIVSGGC